MARRKKAPPPSFATAKGTWDRNHYVMLFDDLLDSPAYRALSAHAKEAYTILLQEYKGPYTENSVICPYATFREKGMRGNTVSRALLMLEHFGFINVERGGLEHQPSVYHFSKAWQEIRTVQDAKERESLFREEMDKRKRAKERLNNGITPYGNDIRSNESVTYPDEKTGEIDNEIDTYLTEWMEQQVTDAVPDQVTKALVAEEPRKYGDRIMGSPATRVH